MSEGEVIIHPDGKPPMEVDLTPMPLALSDADAEKLAQELGLQVISGLRLRRCRELGEHLDRLGAVKVARGQYLISADRMQKVAVKVVEMIHASSDLTAINDVLPNLVVLERQIAACIDGMAKAGVNVEAARTQPVLPPPPIPIVVNNYPANSSPYANRDKTIDALS